MRYVPNAFDLGKDFAEAFDENKIECDLLVANKKLSKMDEWSAEWRAVFHRASALQVALLIKTNEMTEALERMFSARTFSFSS